jgi:DNA-binding MarR family transcriptional regulator
VAGRLQADIKQSRPFSRIEEEAYLNLLRTADALLQRESAMLKQHGLSQTQYNALRILRGAGEEGLPCGEIAERMITHDPDITRLMDRLESKGWVERSRNGRDRRVVIAKITPGGLELLQPLDEPISELLGGMLGHLNEAQLRQLIDLLEQARMKV